MVDKVRPYLLRLRMPHRHSVKTYVKDAYYHAYNRGVEKRDIFLDKQDYSVFLYLLKYYLSPLKENSEHPLKDIRKYSFIRPTPLANLEKEIDLLAFCLMPNHFHLLIKQKTIDGMTKLLRRLLTTYSMYFNKRYDRVGTLYQGKYKAALIRTDEDLLHLSRYIHLNPAEIIRSDLISYLYSSYPYYLGHKKAVWVKPEFILKFFSNEKRLPFLGSHPSYEKFVNKYPQDSKKTIGKLIIE